MNSAQPSLRSPEILRAKTRLKWLRRLRRTNSRSHPFAASTTRAHITTRSTTRSASSTTSWLTPERVRSRRRIQPVCSATSPHEEFHESLIPDLPVGVRSPRTAEFKAALHQARVISRHVEFGDPVFYLLRGRALLLLACRRSGRRPLYSHRRLPFGTLPCAGSRRSSHVGRQCWRSRCNLRAHRRR